MFKLSKSNDINLAKLSEGAENFFSFVPAIKRRRRRRKILIFFKYFFSFVFVAFFLVLISSSVSFLSGVRVYKNVSAGKDNLTQAVSLMRNSYFAESLILSAKAENNFFLASEDLQIVKSGFFVQFIPALSYQFDDLEYLTKTAEILSRTARQIGTIGEELNFLSSEQKENYNFSNLSGEKKEKILKLIYESGPELNGLKANLDLAYFNLDKVRFRGILRPFKDKISEFKIQLEEGRSLISKIMPMMEFLSPLAGYPRETNFLVLLQNNDELRPTGGFLGTYGILKIKNGEIIRFDTHDIYHLDMPVKDKINISPPEPLKEYLGIDKWFMRDANWSPDWPTSAKKIAWFYEKENLLLSPKDQINNFTGKFDGLIGLTPKFITSLLDITGPIFIRGEEYNKDNFHELLQYKVEVDYVNLGVPAWQRKEIIGQIARELKIKLFNLPFGRWREVIDVISENILRKDIIVFFEDKQWQSLAKNLGWAGEIKNTEGDYLMVVDANLASFKTDAIMNKSLGYRVEQTADGLLAKLKINYAHHGGFDWRTTRYRTYVRVYVPAGSKLIKAESAVGKVQINEGEKSINFSEASKTSFEAFISVEPGAIGSLYCEYKLPANLSELAKSGFYSLYIQKQPGRETEELAVDLKVDNSIKLYNPIGFFAEKIGENRIKWKTSLDTDKVFKIGF